MRNGLLIIADRSGSMGSAGKIDEARGGINALIESEDPYTNVSVVIFDDSFETIIKDSNARDVKPLTDENYFARGMTRLYDAIGLAVTEQIERISKMLLKPDKVFVSIFTDGQENASIEFSADRLKEIIEKQRTEFGWEFMFTGTSEESALMAQQNLGIIYSVHTADTGVGTRAAYKANEFAREMFSTGMTLSCTDLQDKIDNA